MISPFWSKNVCIFRPSIRVEKIMVKWKRLPKTELQSADGFKNCRNENILHSQNENERLHIGNQNDKTDFISLKFR